MLLYVLQSLFARNGKFYLHCFAIGIIITSGAYNKLCTDSSTWYMLILGIAGGEVSYAASLIISKLSLTRAARQIASARAVVSYIRNDRLGTAICLVTASAEELLWRCAIQNILGNSILAVVITGSCFALIHLDLRKDILYLSHYLDLLVLSFILGLLYYYFTNFYLVFAVHFVRNINIMNLNSVLEQSYDTTA